MVGVALRVGVRGRVWVRVREVGPPRRVPPHGRVRVRLRVRVRVGEVGAPLRVGSEAVRVLGVELLHLVSVRVRVRVRVRVEG